MPGAMPGATPSGDATSMPGGTLTPTEMEPTEVGPTEMDATAEPTPTPTTGSGTCCTDGDCTCLGPEPTADALRTMGPFTVEKYTDGFPKGTGYLAGTIYYPADAEGQLSVITLCPGWTATQDSVGSVGPWGPFLASHGFVVMTLDTLTTLDVVEQRDEQIMAALNAVNGENTRSGSPLEGRLSGRYGIGGWSMGGGGTWIVAATEPEMQSAMSLAGHHSTVPGFVQTYATKITVPTIIFAGETDIPPLGNRPQSQEIYEGIPESTPKILYEIVGQDHFQFGTPMVTNMGYLGAYGLAFQKTFLDGDERYKQFLLTEGPNASDWRSNVQ